MKKTSTIVLIVVAVILIIAGYTLASYNSLVSMNEAATAQWQQVETQYQRRLDLIPNLVESVKGIMKQEQTVFTALADARTHYAGATTVNDKAAAAGEVETSLGRLLAVVESYPTLASAQNVQDLMTELEGTENRVSVERMRFNDDVQTYNVAIKRFPKSMIAGIFGFAPLTYFQAQAGAENAPTVSF